MEHNIKNDTDDTLLSKIRTINDRINLAMGKANSYCTVLALNMGAMANELKLRRATTNDWGKWSQKYILDAFNISKRTLENYCNIAYTPRVENYTSLGIGILSEIGSLIRRMDDDARQKLGPDPIKHFLTGLNNEATSQEREDHIKAVLDVMRLEKCGIKVELEVMKEFHDVGGTLSKAKREYLSRLYQANNENGGGSIAVEGFLQEVVKNNGNWEATLPQSELENEFSHAKEKSKRNPNFAMQATTLKQSITKLLSMEKIPSNVTPDVLDELMNHIQDLKNRLLKKEDSSK